MTQPQQHLTTIESAVAFLGNGFIIAVKGHQWLQNWKMAPCDCLLTSLSTSRIMQQLIVMINNILYYSLPENYTRTITKDIATFCWIFLTHVSLWCATWLNIFYCVKVTNFPHHLFLWLKLRINVLAPRLLGMVVIALMLFSVHPTILYFENKNVTASMVLLISLWRHIRYLRKRGSVIKDLSTQVYLNVMKSLLFSLFFGITYFASLIIPMVSLYRKGTNARLALEIVLSAVPSAHSMILILSNQELKEILMHILHIRQRAALKEEGCPKVQMVFSNYRY
nr:taste receptor type 2 member 8-like [Zootoca vivipara]